MARVKMTPDRLKELGITMEDVRNYRKHMGAAKWKRQNEAKEAKKRKRAREEECDRARRRRRERATWRSTVIHHRNPRVHKTPKARGEETGKAKVVVVAGSGGNDRGWKPSDSDHGSSEGNEEEDDIVREDKRRAKLYKKLKKVHRRPNMVPEAKADFNQSTLEDYDVRRERPPTPSAKSGPSHVGEDGAAELGELLAKFWMRNLVL
ncbi:hypothetical protein K1719_002758 [Acacia pycnantha]|nr:hypothetical protein K1719_002758 [Acacia pycnantha]